jgi:hypothetical protein
MWSIPFRVQATILYAFLLSPISDTFPDHLILLDLITLKIFGKESPNYAFLQSIVTFSFLGSHILPSTGIALGYGLDDREFGSR